MAGSSVSFADKIKALEQFFGAAEAPLAERVASWNAQMGIKAADEPLPDQVERLIVAWNG